MAMINPVDRSTPARVADISGGSESALWFRHVTLSDGGAVKGTSASIRKRIADELMAEKWVVLYAEIPYEHAIEYYNGDEDLDATITINLTYVGKVDANEANGYESYYLFQGLLGNRLYTLKQAFSDYSLKWETKRI